MSEHVKAQELPGIGWRYDIACDGADARVSVVVHKDGHRELYAFESRAQEPTAVVELTDQQARVLGAVLNGTYFGD